MTDYAISICNRIIIWNDDNHESEVYFNGEKAGYLGDELDCITTVAERAAAAGPKPTICKRVYIFDLCEVMDDEEENKEDFEKLVKFFQTTTKFTPEQEQAIFNEDYNKLLELIQSKI